MSFIRPLQRTALAGLCIALTLAFGTAQGGPPEDKGHGKSEKSHVQKEHGKPSQEQSRTYSTSKPDHDRGGDLETLVTVGLTVGAIEGLLGRDLAPITVGAEPLPPGIRKNLARGKPLPPGLARQQVAPELTARLPHYDGYEWARVGTDLILVGIVSGVVSDVVHDVFH